MSPEAILAGFKDLYNHRKGATEEKDYLTVPISGIWDLYILSMILRIYNDDIADELIARLSSCIRVAGAIFATKNDADLRPFTIASITVDPTIIDTVAIRGGRPKIERAAADDAARVMQDTLVLRLLNIELASRELAAVLSEKSALIQAPPALPPVPAGGGDVPDSLSPKTLLISVPKSKFSKATQELLVDEYKAKSAADTIDDIDVVAILSQLDTASHAAGSQLFSSATPTQIVEFDNQAKLLRTELARTGTIESQKISALALSIAPPLPLPIPVPILIGNSYVRPLGVGDLKVVKQNLLRYEAGEVADIQNALKGQQKERVHSVKQTTEETIIVEQEKTTSNERDLQTTDRFELSEQINATFSEKRQNEAGVNVTASYGPVSISANTKFSDSSSQEQSSKISRNFARDVVDKSVQKVEQRVREQRTSKTTLQVEETNKYTQTAPDKNVVGIYRWVDKIYWAQVNVYGKRLMLEFMVPEPAALYVHSLTKKPVDAAAVKPPPPLTIQPDQLNRSNYAALAALYAAQVENPPPSIQLAKFMARTNSDTQQTKLSVDEGYVGLYAGPAASWIGPNGTRLFIHIADQIWDTNNRNWTMQPIAVDSSGDVPLLVTNFRAQSYNVAGVVVCAPSQFAMAKWQLATYKALVDAFNMRQTEYQQYIASQNRGDGQPQVMQDQISKDVQQRELQRACIEILSLQHFDHFGAIVDNNLTGWPEINFNAARQQGNYASFFQQSFEWEEITYVYYPYFWARQAKWPERLAANAGDELFNKFLRAGFARAVVPVRPAHESDVLFFLETGAIWGGTEPPVLGDKTYLSIVDEIKESLGAPDGGVPDGAPWQFKIPTSLIVLEESEELPEWPAPVPSPGVFIPSAQTCDGIPYNAGQWKDGKSIADAIRKLGYSLDAAGDQDQAIARAKGVIRAMQMRFNELGVASLLGRPLIVDGIVGPCTLRALTYYDALRNAGKWPGIS